MTLIKNKIKSAENKELLKNPLVRGMLNTIRYAEGTAGEDGYNTRVGGGKFTDLSKKPGKKVYIKSIDNYSSAEGAFQILNGTWSAVAKDLGLTDFLPESQDIAAVELIKRRGALNDILAGNFETAVNKLSPEWASLPKSDGKGTYKNQKVRNIQQLSNVFYKNVDVNNSVKPYINTPEESTYVIDTPEVSNFISPINIPTLAEPNETEAVQKAKEELNNKQQQQLNQQRFIQDLLVASQVQYVDPNQVQQGVTYPDSEQYYQKGGTYYDLPMNNPVIRNNITPRQFSLDYINSLNYKQRLKNSGYKNINEEIGIRRQNVEDVNINNERPFTIMSKLGFSNRPPAGSHFNGEDINLDFEYDKEKMAELYPKFIPPSKNETLAHELTHAQLFDQDNPIVKNRLNSYDLNQLTRRLKDNKSDKNTSHDILPDENKADLDAYRYILKRDGVYDTNTEEFTKEHLKLPTKSFTKQRLLKNYKEDDLIWLMNNIAQNEENDLIYAQNGGSIQNSQEFLKNWYPNRVLPDSSLNSTYQAEKNLYLNQAQTLPVPNYVNQIDTENTQGTYDINTNQINLLNTANPLVYTHEATHAINLPLKDTQSNVNAFNIIGQNVIPRENIQNEWVKQNYPQISNYQEIIPRLNAYRQKYNLQPTQVITPELIQQNRQQYINTADFEDNTDQLYKLFENEGLSNVLNKVVSVDNSSQYYGEKGGVIRDDQGYWNPDNWGKIVEINSNNISMQNVKQPLIGVSNETGEARLMIPGKEYTFSSTKKVTEYPTKRNKNKRFS